MQFDSFYKREITAAVFSNEFELRTELRAETPRCVFSNTLQNTFIHPFLLTEGVSKRLDQSHEQQGKNESGQFSVSVSLPNLFSEMNIYLLPSDGSYVGSLVPIPYFK